MTRALGPEPAEGRTPRFVRTRPRVGPPLVGVSLVYLAVCAGLLLAALAPSLLGWHATVVDGGSMGPSLRAGDVVVYKRTDPTALRRGDVIVVHTGSAPGLLVHRLVALRADGTLRTKGDANSTVDSTPVSPKAVQGVGQIAVPFVGLPRLWSRQDPAMLLVWVVSLVLACRLVSRRRTALPIPVVRSVRA